MELSRRGFISETKTADSSLLTASRFYHERFHVEQPSNNNILKIEVETIRAGQPRPYADSYYESIITYDRPLHEQVVSAHSKILVRQWKPEGERMWADGVLEKLEPIDPTPASQGKVASKWRVVVRSPFTD